MILDFLVLVGVVGLVLFFIVVVLVGVLLGIFLLDLVVLLVNWLKILLSFDVV